MIFTILFRFTFSWNKISIVQKIYLFTCSPFAAESSERSWNVEDRVGVEKFGERKLQIEWDRNFVEEYQILCGNPLCVLEWDLRNYTSMFSNFIAIVGFKRKRNVVLSKFLQFIPIFTIQFHSQLEIKIECLIKFHCLFVI